MRLSRHQQVARHPQLRNVTHQRAGEIRVDFKTDPTAGSVAWYARHGRELVGCKSPVRKWELLGGQYTKCNQTI